MSRGDVERLSRDEPIRLVLKLQRPAKTSRTSSEAPSIDRKGRRKLVRSLGDILAAPVTCDLTHDTQNRQRRARRRLLTFVAYPGRVGTPTNACNRNLRPP